MLLTLVDCEAAAFCTQYIDAFWFNRSKAARLIIAHPNVNYNLL